MKRWCVALAAVVIIVVSGCSTPNISSDSSDGPTTTTPAASASQQLSSGLTMQQQYLAKYHQLFPLDKSSDQSILAAAQKFCDQIAPPSGATDPMSQIIAFWQELNCSNK